MKFFCGIIFAGAAFVLLNLGYAQDGRKKVLATPADATWQYYDSIAATRAFERDTIGALENYSKAVLLNPANDQLKKNYERLNYLYIKSTQSFYNINP